MTTALARLKTLLQNAEEAATMQNMGLGFPNDCIEVKSVHFGNDRKGRVGDLIHPTDYVRNITELYRESWILAPLREALAIVEANEALIEQLERVETLMLEAGLNEIRYLNAAGRTQLAHGIGAAQKAPQASQPGARPGAEPTEAQIDAYCQAWGAAFEDEDTESVVVEPLSASLRRCVVAGLRAAIGATTAQQYAADAERWRAFLSTRPENTHEVINQAIDAAIAAQKGKP